MEGRSLEVGREISREGRMEGRACVVNGRNKEGPWPTCSAWPIKAKPLCPFFFSGTSSRVSPSSRPQTDLSSSRPFLSVPTFVPVSLFLLNSRHTISLPAHRKDYHTRNTRLRTVVPPTIIVFVSSLLSLFPFPPLLSFFETRFLAPSHDSDRVTFLALPKIIPDRTKNFISNNPLSR